MEHQKSTVKLTDLQQRILDVVGSGEIDTETLLEKLTDYNFFEIGLEVNALKMMGEISIQIRNGTNFIRKNHG